MDKEIILEKNDNNIDLYDPYPPFGELLDFAKLNKHAIDLCPTLRIENIDSSFIMQRDAVKNATENVIQLDQENNAKKGVPKSINELKKTQAELTKRKKTKKSHPVVEYPASQIPDNKGSILSVDDLVKYVNGTDGVNIKCIAPNNGIRMEKKHKTVITNKKQSNDFDGGEKNAQSISNGSNESQSTLQMSSPLERKKPSEDNSLNANDNGNTGDDNQDDDAFFQVVRRKGRQKKLELKSVEANMTMNRSVRDKSDKMAIGATCNINKGTVMVNDKESLNLFINRLWMEFQSHYQKYISEEHKRVPEPETC